MYKFFTLLTLLTLSSTISVSQKNYEDSIKNILAQEEVDSVKIELIIALAEKFSKSDTRKFYNYSFQAFKRSQNSSYKKGVVLSAANLGYYNRIRAEYDSALYYYHLSIEYSSKTDPKRSNTLYSIGNVYKAMGDFTKATESYISSLKVAEENQSDKDIAIAQLGLGSVYTIQNNLSKALEYFLKTHEAFKKINDQRGIYISSNNIGTSYYKLEEFSKAKIYFEKSKKLAKENNDIKGLGNILGNISSIHKQEGKLDSALHYANLALDIRKKFEMKEGVIISYHNLSEINIALKRFQIAEYYLDTALILCNEIKSIKELKFNWNYRAMLDSTRGDYKSAFKSLLKYYSFRTKVEQKEIKANIEKLQTKYETEKKEAEIKSLSQQAAIQSLEIRQKNQAIVISIVILLLIVLIIFFINRQQFSKREKQQTELEQRFLRSQLNPHFISNALVAVQNYMLKNQTETASSYLSKFSKLMREILENSRKSFIALDDEVNMLTNYLDIHKLRMNDTFDYKIEIDENIDSEVDTIPPMFVQPFIENAIEHGIVNTNGKGLIEVNFMKENEYISIVVKDNGRGINQTLPKQADHKSLSSTIIQERMALFNKTLKNKIQLVLNEIRNEQGEIEGTKVELKVPFSYV